jgi:hypothetical protein
MARISIPEVLIRTTSGGDGYAHGIAVGAGDDPGGALSELAADAKAMIADLARRLRVRAADVAAPGDWGIEVADVRLVPGVDLSIQAAWTAYGTVRTTGISPIGPLE